MHNVTTYYACDNVVWNKFRKEKKWGKNEYIAIRYSQLQKNQLFVKLPSDFQLIDLFAGLPSFDLEDNTRVTFLRF